MSYRPHGRAKVSATRPVAWAVCDFCGFLYNKPDLRWQYEWAGPRTQNQNQLVCQTCYDKPQEQLRTIIIPPDPDPVDDVRIERYNLDDNPVSPIGLNIGNLTQAGGLAAAFDSNTNKPIAFSATLFNSTTSNTVGKNWSLLYPTQGVMASSFTVWAPNNARFLASGTASWVFSGSNTSATVGFVTLASGTTAGTLGETIGVTLVPATGYLYHRFLITGDGTSASVAQLKISQVG